MTTPKFFAGREGLPGFNPKVDHTKGSTHNRNFNVKITVVKDNQYLCTIERKPKSAPKIGFSSDGTKAKQGTLDKVVDALEIDLLAEYGGKVKVKGNDGFSIETDTCILLVAIERTDVIQEPTTWLRPQVAEKLGIYQKDATEESVDIY